MEKYSDKYIVSQIRKGKNEFVSVLYDKYKFFARKLTHSYLVIHKDNGITFDDIYSRAFESIDTACKHFDEKISSSFYSYWRTIAIHEIEDMLLEESYSGRAKAFYGISLDAKILDDETTYSEVYGVHEPLESDEEVRTRFKEIITDPKNGFKKTERTILLSLIDGKEHIEIKKKLKICTSTYRYHYHKATEKLKNLLESN